MHASLRLHGPASPALNGRSARGGGRQRAHPDGRSGQTAWAPSCPAAPPMPVGSPPAAVAAVARWSLKQGSRDPARGWVLFPDCAAASA